MNNNEKKIPEEQMKEVSGGHFRPLGTNQQKPQMAKENKEQCFGKFDNDGMRH